MSALIFEVQDFQKRKLKVIKRSQVHIFRALVLLTGFCVLKDTLNLPQNRFNWLRNKYTRWKLLAPGFGLLSKQCISLLILSFLTLLSKLCVLLKYDCSFIISETFWQFQPPLWVPIPTMLAMNAPPAAPAQYLNLFTSNFFSCTRRSRNFDKILVQNSASNCYCLNKHFKA